MHPTLDPSRAITPANVARVSLQAHAGNGVFYSLAWAPDGRSLAVGTTLGLGVAQLVALVSPLAAAATPSAVALGIAFSAAVGLLFGSWPAWRAANLDPVEALRWE